MVSKRNPHVLDYKAYNLPCLQRKTAISLCDPALDSGVKVLPNLSGQRVFSPNLFLTVLAVICYYFFLTKHESFSLYNQTHLHGEKGNHFVQSFGFELSKNYFI